MADEAVMATNDDATLAKRSAVQRGYWHDGFINVFGKAPPPHLGAISPITHRGYYIRVTAVWRHVLSFLRHAGGDGQIVNLGCGYDTLFWRLQEAGVPFSGFFEIDFPAVVEKKRRFVEKDVTLAEQVQYKYHIDSADLRKIEEVEASLRAAGLNFEKPTLFLAECVLVYMNPEDGDRLIKWSADSFTTVGWINYDPINPTDPFGKMMVENLQRRGCSFKAIHTYCSKQAFVKRYTSAGYEGATALDIGQVRDSLPREDVVRMERIEFLDELEEWILFNHHYCIAFAWKDGAGIRLRDVTFVA